MNSSGAWRPDSLLPYAPLPTAAFAAVSHSLQQRGFAPQAILSDYQYSSQAGTFTLNALAFADAQRRTPDAFAGVTVYHAVTERPDTALVPTLAQTAAPFHLIHREGQFTFWASALQHQQIAPVRLADTIAYDQLERVLTDYAVDLAPAKIVDVKAGREQFTHAFLREAHPVQLALWAVGVTQQRLVATFGQAMAHLREHPQIQDTVAATGEDPSIDLAIQLLGAVILADTGILGEALRHRDQDLSFSEVIQAAAQHYAMYFDLRRMQDYDEAAKTTYQILRTIRYTGFVPDMLSALYATAYDQTQRKMMGRYDTPLYLTQRIWDTIPVAFLPPEQRVAVDMTCGWGSFLIAGHHRLARLTDMQGRSLRNYLHGNDIDPFTARLAGLGLLLSTAEDTWHIDHAPALDWTWLQTQRPGIIVGNPPFGGRRDTPDHLAPLPPAEGKPTRVEAANAYLQHALQRLAPGGYLAMVLPQSFLVSEAAPALRQELLESCDILDIWYLPGAVFPAATVQPMVLFTQKHPHPHRVHAPVRVRTVQKHTLPVFKTQSIFTASSVVPDQSQWGRQAKTKQTSQNSHRMTTPILFTSKDQAILRETCHALANVVTIVPGLIRGANPHRKRHQATSEQVRIQWLTNAPKVVPRPWHLNYDVARTAWYPGNFEKPRLSYQAIFATSKVLFIASPNPSWGRRSKAVIERRGYYASDSFLAMTPSTAAPPTLTLEVLAAILNWYVSNAWIVDQHQYPRIPRHTVTTIPIPRTIDAAMCDQLTIAVHALEAAAQADLPAPADAQTTIDTILQDAYQLDAATIERFKQVANWDRAPQLTLDPQADRRAADYRISGIVEYVDPHAGTITLWMRGFAALQTVPIDPQMPGWLLRPAIAFRTMIPTSCKYKESLESVIWGAFEPQNYTYLSDDELVANLAAVFE